MLKYLIFFIFLLVINLSITISYDTNTSTSLNKGKNKESGKKKSKANITNPMNVLSKLRTKPIDTALPKLSVNEEYKRSLDLDYVVVRHPQYSKASHFIIFENIILKSIVKEIIDNNNKLELYMQIDMIKNYFNKLYQNNDIELSEVEQTNMIARIHSRVYYLTMSPLTDQFIEYVLKIYEVEFLLIVRAAMRIFIEHVGLKKNTELNIKDRINEDFSKVLEMFNIDSNGNSIHMKFLELMKLASQLLLDNLFLYLSKY